MEKVLATYQYLLFEYSRLEFRCCCTSIGGAGQDATSFHACNNLLETDKLESEVILQWGSVGCCRQTVVKSGVDPFLSGETTSPFVPAHVLESLSDRDCRFAES
jgi:hypothetical protein